MDNLRGMPSPLSIILLNGPVAPGDVLLQTAAIGEAVLRDSQHLRQRNFVAIHTDDLRRLFGLYDERFFASTLGRAVLDQTGTPLEFALSSRMTRAGGQTLSHRIRVPGGGRAVGRYSIGISTRLIFMTFKDIQRTVRVGGLECHDRLDALQRIMEHEIIHLAELLAWGKSSCKAPRFKDLARRFFGHVETTHNLVTPRERAAVHHDVRVGQDVEFDFEGRRYTGRVNRIHHRATVLVEDPAGARYSDGKIYRKFYIPLPMLRPRASAIL